MIRLSGITVAVQALVLCVLPLPAAANDAARVKDRMSLEEFVKAAREAVADANPADRDALYDFADTTFRPRGAWRDGSIYVYVLTEEGVNVFHGGNRSYEGQDLWENEDLNGTLYTQELVKAARNGGGFVTYWFDDPEVPEDDMEGSPKVSYAADLLEVDGEEYVIGSGIYPGADPDVTARQVESSMEDKMLRAFVKGARDATEILEATEDTVAYNFFDTQFRPEGDWRHRSIYVFVLTEDGVIYFHGATESLEGVDLWEDEDKNGKRYVQQLIMNAQMDGEEVVDYYFDNPDVMGDEEDGSQKHSWATRVKKPSGGHWVIGSGYYRETDPATDVPVAPPLAYLILAALLAGAGFLRRRPR